MTSLEHELGEFLRGLIQNEEAAQQYLLDPEAALTAAGLYPVSMVEVRLAADDLGLQSRFVDTEPTEAIRTLLQRSYTKSDAYLNILSGKDLSQEFHPAQGATR